MNITFLGAADTVTGSKYLVQTERSRVMVDCGLFQGLKRFRLRNREPLSVDPASLDAVVLTHAHLDHSGYVPLLVREGFRGPIYCTSPTRDLCGVLLPDSGHLQEEEAEYANRHGFSKHRPALPLYTEADARRSLESFQGVGFGEPISVAPDITARLEPAGHLLGAAVVRLSGDGTDIVFSGDLGRPGDPMLPDPARIDRTDYLVVESTYGDRRHGQEDPLDQIAGVVQETSSRGGSVLIPSFAVGRAQLLLLLLYRLKQAGRIPDIPVFLDSPMANRATQLFLQHAKDLGLPEDEVRAACAMAEPVESVEESKSVDRMTYPRIVISASGMATGGRVVHHLKVFAPDDRNTLLFAGHQAVGTRGATIVGGAPKVKIHGHYVPIHADVRSLRNISAHADSEEILDWLRKFGAAPRQTFVTHGEPEAADAMRRRIEEELGWEARVPEHGERVRLRRATPQRAMAEIPPIPAPVV